MRILELLNSAGSVALQTSATQQNVVAAALVIIVLCGAGIGMMWLRRRSAQSPESTDANVLRETGVQLEDIAGLEWNRAMQRQLILILGGITVPMTTVMVLVMLTATHLVDFVTSVVAGGIISGGSIVVVLAVFVITIMRQSGKNYLMLNFNPRNPAENFMSGFFEIDGAPIVIRTRDALRSARMKRAQLRNMWGYPGQSPYYYPPEGTPQ